MKRSLAFVAALWCAAIVLAGCGGSSPTPLHVASLYVDAVNHGDFRQACQQIQPAVRRNLWGGIAGCEAYFTGAFGFNALMGGGLGGYRVVAHSTVEWLEGDVRVARVSVTAPDGSLLHVRLVETKRGGWRIAAIGS